MTLPKTALITGASSGIGEACVTAFAEAGYTVVAAGRDAERTRAVADAHERVAPWIGDLTEPEAAGRLTETAMNALGDIGVLVNSAGVIYRADVTGTTDAQWDTTMAVNVTAVFRLCRAVVPHMTAAGGGRIVNIASDWGLKGGARAMAYCASKGAVVLMTRAMAIDHVADGIRVNAICPGDVDTPMVVAEAQQQGIELDAARRLCDADSPTGRMTRADEVAALAVFLAADAAEQINGAAIPIDGGNLA